MQVNIGVLGMMFLLIIHPVSWGTYQPATAHQSTTIELDQVATYDWIWHDLVNTSVLNGSIDADDSVYWGPSLGPYLNSTETKTRLEMLAEKFPDIVSYFDIGMSYQNKSIPGIVIQKPFDQYLERRYDSLLIANHHAREAITVVDAMLFAERLVHDFLLEEIWATKLLSVTTIYVIPILNPDGLDHTWINPWQRRNLLPIDGDGDGSLEDEFEIQDRNGDGYVHMSSGRLEGIDSNDSDDLAGEDLPGGIDLNRNYDVEFIGTGSSDNPNSPVYRGTFPFEAPETAAFKSFAEGNRFTMAMSLHSGIEAIISPWGFTSDPVPDEDLFANITQQLQDRSYMPTWEQIGGYRVNGEWGDYMYGRLNSIAMTIETFGDQSSFHYLTSTTFVGVWSAFNPDANKIYNVSMAGVQKHLDYYFSVPQEEYYDQGFEIINFVANRDADDLDLEIDIVVETKQTITLERFDENRSRWIGLENHTLDDTTLFRNSFSVDPGIADDDLRIFIGDDSRGVSYYMDFSNGQIGSSNFDAENTESITQSDTDKTRIQFVLGMAMVVFVYRISYCRKYLDLN